MRPLFPAAALLWVAAFTFFLPCRLAAEPLPTRESDTVVSDGFFPDFLVPLPDGSRYLAGEGIVRKLNSGGNIAWSGTMV